MPDVLVRRPARARGGRMIALMMDIVIVFTGGAVAIVWLGDWVRA